MDLGPVGRIPQAGRGVVAPGQEGAPVGAEGDRPDPLLVPEDRAGGPARPGVPEPSRTVVSGGGDQVSARAEGDGEDPVFVDERG